MKKILQGAFNLQAIASHYTLSDYMGRSLLDQCSHLHSRLATAEMLLTLHSSFLISSQVRIEGQHLSPAENRVHTRLDIVHGGTQVLVAGSKLDSGIGTGAGHCALCV